MLERAGRPASGYVQIPDSPVMISREWSEGSEKIARRVTAIDFSRGI